MNALMEALTAAAPTAAVILVETTLIFLATALVQRLMRRFPAARHALLLLALVMVGLCPAIMIVGRHVTLPAPIPARDLPIQAWIHQPEASVAAMGAVQTTPAHHFSLAALLLLAWTGGTLVSLLGMIRSWRKMLRIQKSARILSEERIVQALDRVAITFKCRPPRVLASQHVGVPLAVGSYHPVVLLPASLAQSLDDSELLHVLVHECAHVFRRDTLVKIYQRFLSALLWFHPLVHIVNRLLDGAREDPCDNYVLRVATPAEYSRTLLAVAESVVLTPGGLLAPALVRPAESLESRVTKLLDNRRCAMTRLKSSTVAVIAVAFVGCVLALGSLAASPAAGKVPDNSSLRHVVTPEAGATSHATDAQGDSITIESVRETSDKLSTGNTYEVRGAYKLVSRSKALLAIWVTSGPMYGLPSAITVRDQKGRLYRLVPFNPNDSHRSLADQREVVNKGEGHFTLRFHLWGAGGPHVSFYPYEGGSSFLGAYFLTPPPLVGHGIDVMHPAR
jgi:beta-lactamase regulating signal transducer with metallopeptidase domain